MANPIDPFEEIHKRLKQAAEKAEYYRLMHEVGRTLHGTGEPKEPEFRVIGEGVLVKGGSDGAVSLQGIR